MHFGAACSRLPVRRVDSPGLDTAQTTNIAVRCWRRPGRTTPAPLATRQSMQTLATRDSCRLGCATACLTGGTRQNRRSKEAESDEEQHWNETVKPLRRDRKYLNK